VEFEQLRAFVEVADRGQFSAAASRLHLTRPALTQRIQALERRLGVSLFERDSRAVRLTAAADLLLPYARTILADVEAATSELRNFRAGMAGQLKIARPINADSAVTTVIMQRYASKYPKVGVQFEVGNSQVMLRRLQSGELDAAFVRMPLPDLPGLASLTVGGDPLLVALRADHPLAAMNPIPVIELRERRVMFYHRELNPHMYDAIVNWLRQATGSFGDLLPPGPLTSDVVALVMAGATAAPFPLLAQAVTYRPLEPALELGLALVYRADEAEPALTNLIALAAKVVAAAIPPGRSGEALASTKRQV
jgi:DNA-binding transcriptional LysR family regulator